MAKVHPRRLTGLIFGWPTAEFMADLLDWCAELSNHETLYMPSAKDEGYLMVDTLQVKTNIESGRYLIVDDNGDIEGLSHDLLSPDLLKSDWVEIERVKL